MIAYAEIYSSTDPSGHVTYSDTPLSNDSKKVDLPEPNVQVSQQTTSNPSMPAPAATTQILTTTSPQITGTQSYTVFKIQTPTDQQTIQNQPVIPVEIVIKPDLQPGDQIQLFLDNKPIGQPNKNTQFTLTNIDRGQHTLSAAILNNQQKIIQKTETITIYNHRAHLGNQS